MLYTWAKSSEISILALYTAARALKPVREYGRLKTVTMEMKELCSYKRANL